MSRFPGADAYAEQAAQLIERYESVDPNEVHEEVAHLIPEGPLRALDVGAGTGRDAAWLAAKGHAVVAVEPTEQMRAAGQRLHRSPLIEWIDDGLPDLTTLNGRDPFDLIMLTAVWMHLDAEERTHGMARLAHLCKRGRRGGDAAAARAGPGGAAHVSSLRRGNRGARGGLRIHGAR